MSIQYGKTCFGWVLPLLFFLLLLSVGSVIIWIKKEAPIIMELISTPLLHRMLPLHLKALGDQYVKEEFRRHKAVSPAEAKLFMKEWESYAAMMWEQSKSCLYNPDTEKMPFGASLSEEKLDLLSPEQIGQLHELMQEATKPKKQFEVSEDSGQKT